MADDDEMMTVSEEYKYLSYMNDVPEIPEYIR